MNFDAFESAFEKSEKDFEKVKEFLRDNPISTAYDISDATGVSHGQIMKWIDEGRLELKANMGMVSSRKQDNSLADDLRSAKDELSNTGKKEGLHGMYVTSKK